jgi:hypothetical protein
MMPEPEVYRGISFIRTATLPPGMRRTFYATFDTRKMIKILRDKELLNDCVLYADFVSWQQAKAVKPEQEG